MRGNRLADLPDLDLSIYVGGYATGLSEESFNIHRFIVRIVFEPQPNSSIPKVQKGL